MTQLPPAVLITVECFCLQWLPASCTIAGNTATVEDVVETFIYSVRLSVLWFVGKRLLSKRGQHELVGCIVGKVTAQLYNLLPRLCQCTENGEQLSFCVSFSSFTLFRSRLRQHNTPFISRYGVLTVLLFMQIPPNSNPL